MKPARVFTVPVLCLAFLICPAFGGERPDEIYIRSITNLLNNLDLIERTYGPDVARVYGTVEGMPTFDIDSCDGLTIRYTRDDNPCNKIFLQENPDMVKDCRKTREKLTFVNRYQKIVQVHIKDGKIVSIDLKISLDHRNYSKTRSVIILYNALIVHDCILARYSRNHAKIFHFPGVVPTVEFDEEQSVFLRFGKQDFIKFHAEDFRNTESHGFKMSCRPRFYRNGTRAVPDISYKGRQPHMAITNWTYPPLSGYFTLHDGSKRVGKVPATFFYKRMRNDRALPLFQKTGLLNYLKKQYKNGSLKRYYGRKIHKFVQVLLKKNDAKYIRNLPPQYPAQAQLH